MRRKLSQSPEAREARALRAELRALGLCPTCRADVAGPVHCDSCRVRRRARDAARVSRRRASGLCLDCEHKAIRGHVRCAIHRAANKARSRRRYLKDRARLTAFEHRTSASGEVKDSDALVGRWAGMADSDFRRQRRQDKALFNRLRHAKDRKDHPERCREYQRKYLAKPGVKERCLERGRAYRARPDVKARLREHYRRKRAAMTPEQIAAHNAYHREWQRRRRASRQGES